MAGSRGNPTDVQAYLRREPDNLVESHVINNYDLL
jgi:hypothetical protein